MNEDFYNENNIDWFEEEIGSGLEQEPIEEIYVYKGKDFYISVEPDTKRKEGFLGDPYFKYYKGSKKIRSFSKDGSSGHHNASGGKLGSDELPLDKKAINNIKFALDQQCNAGPFNNSGMTVRDAISKTYQDAFGLSDKEFQKYDFGISDFENSYDRAKEPLKAKVAKFIPTKKEREKLDKDPKARADLEKQIKDELKGSYKNVEDYLKAINLVK